MMSLFYIHCLKIFLNYKSIRKNLSLFDNKINFTAELSKTNSRYSISKRQTANEWGGGERYETIFDVGDKQNS